MAPIRDETLESARTSFSPIQLLCRILDINRIFFFLHLPHAGVFFQVCLLCTNLIFFLSPTPPPSLYNNSKSMLSFYFDLFVYLPVYNAHIFLTTFAFTIEMRIVHGSNSTPSVIQFIDYGRFLSGSDQKSVVFS